MTKSTRMYRYVPSSRDDDLRALLVAELNILSFAKRRMKALISTLRPDLIGAT